VNTEGLLLVLRGVTAIVLLGFLGAVMAVLWRDYHMTARVVSGTQRHYGRLVVIAAGTGIGSADPDAADAETTRFEGGGSLLEAAELVGTSFPLLPLTSLGRGPTNTIVLHDTFCSQEHALVTHRDGQWWLEDRLSSNGTLLNGESVTDPVVVSAGDVIGIGRVQLRVELD
jgi:hypothetical protein